MVRQINSTRLFFSSADSEISPFARFGIIPIGGRSTAIKLKSGDVWVLASTPLNDVTKGKLAEIGPVRCVPQ